MLLTTCIFLASLLHLGVVRVLNCKLTVFDTFPIWLLNEQKQRAIDHYVSKISRFGSKTREKIKEGKPG